MSWPTRTTHHTQKHTEINPMGLAFCYISTNSCWSFSSVMQICKSSDNITVITVILRHYWSLVDLPVVGMQSRDLASGCSALWREGDRSKSVPDVSGCSKQRQTNQKQNCANCCMSCFISADSSFSEEVTQCHTRIKVFPVTLHWAYNWSRLWNPVMLLGRGDRHKK